jgi:hypothetical protein
MSKNDMISLPVRHAEDCLCEACWLEKLGGERYSRDILLTLARQALPLGDTFCLYFLYLANKELLYPLSHDELYGVIEGASSGRWQPPRVSKPRKRGRRRVQVID